MSRPDPPTPASDRREIRVLVIDDESLAREFLRNVLQEMSGVRVVGEAGDVVDAVAAIRDTAPDLVLLDVRLPPSDGFDVIEQVGADLMPAVVFVTAHETYTLRAFDVHALDYVLKPVDPERLRAAVRHARSFIEADAETLSERLAGLLAELRPGQPESRYPQRITVREGERIAFVRLGDVDWVESARNYVRLHVGEQSHLVRHSLGGLLARLDPARFVRIHRSAAVNLDRVREVRPWAGGEYVVILRTGERLRLTRTYRDRLLRLLH